MTPEQYCQQKTASSGSSFYYSFLFLTPDVRRAITALYAFCREVDDVVDEIADKDVAQKKLDWWRYEIVETFAGTANHPVTKEIILLIEPYALPQSLFEDIIDGMQMDLVQSQYSSLQELETYCYRAASAVGLLAARLFGYTDPGTLDYAHDLGMAFQLTNIIRDVKEDAERERIYLPQDLMAHCGVSRESLVNGEYNDALHGLLLQLASRAESWYESAHAQLPDCDRWQQRSGIIMSDIYHALLVRMREQNFNVMKGRVAISKLGKLWLAWKAARREHKRHQAYLKQAA